MHDGVLNVQIRELWERLRCLARGRDEVKIGVFNPCPNALMASGGGACWRLKHDAPEVRWKVMGYSWTRLRRISDNGLENFPT